ncbi:MAG: PIN domain-containing protein [Betaproteobacteria bacterium]|nr:PIN domain-containing protein [Betaproteobacteria bacterium]
MAKSPEVYVDTSALIALLDRSDTYHPLFRQLFAAPPKLASTSLVIAEGHGWFLSRYDRFRAMQFMAMIEDMTPLTVWPVGPVEIAGATAIMRKYKEQDLTLADAAGLHHMLARKIRHCWSTDFHLAMAGAALVINR